MYELLAEIKNLKKENLMGANFLSNWALELLKNYMLIKKEVPTWDNLQKVFDCIVEARPSMSALYTKLSYFLKEVSEVTEKDVNFTEFLIGITQIHKEMNKIDEFGQKKINDLLIEKIPDDSVILTHSYSSSTVKALANVAKNKKDIHFIVTESRPMKEGRIVAKDLIKLAPVTFIVDSSVGYWMNQNQVDVVVLGADSILANGDLVNKIGTYSLALFAHELKIPFYSISSRWKFDVGEVSTGRKIEIAERPAEEVWDHNIINDNLDVINYYFDITPGKLITSYLTDFGEIKPEKINELIMKQFPIDWIKDNFK